MAKKRAADDDELMDALYAASPRAFVTERARVVAGLKAAGRDDEARVVAKLKRPSASVWAVNQLARLAPDELEALVALGASLRAGERALLRGGDAAGFMDEARTARQKVAALARRAEAIVEDSGQKSTLALSRKIAQTLQAASTGDDATRAQLAAGRLEEDLAPSSSFGAGDLSAALAASAGGKGKAIVARARAASAAADKIAAAAEEKARKTRERKGAAATRTGDAGEQASAAAGRVRAKAERAHAAAALRAQRREQAAARKHAAALARAATAAERVVTERARAVERLRAAVERAESELRAAKDALAAAELTAAAARRAAADAAR